MKSRYPRGTLQLTTATDLRGNNIHENNHSLSLEDVWIRRRAFAVSICLNALLSKITASLSPWKKSVVPLIENYIKINTALLTLSGCMPFGLHSFHFSVFRKDRKYTLKKKKICDTVQLRGLNKRLKYTWKSQKEQSYWATEEIKIACK